MNTHDAVLDALALHDVGTIFTLLAEDTMGLLSTLAEDWSDQFRLIHTRHEQGAVAMADGYSRVSGDIGVCLVGRGPAIAQTGSGLLTARRRGSKLLVLVPTSPVSERYDLKRYQQETYLESTVGEVSTITSHETLVEDLREAFRHLHAGRGPVAVQVPWDLLDSDREIPDTHESHTGDGLAWESRPSRPSPDDELVSEAVEHYLDSDATRQPVIVAGRGAVESEAKAAIEHLADRMDAALATTIQAQGYFADHPFSVGFVGTFGSSLANEFLSESDFVVAIGCSLNPHTTDSGHLLDGATVVHVDADRTNIGRYHPVDLGIEGDARATVEVLVAELERSNIDRSGSFWTDSRRRQIQESTALDDGPFPDQPGTIDPRDLVRELDSALPEERLLIGDGGHFLRWVLDGIEIGHPSDFIWTLDFGSIGLGLPVGIGAAWAETRRKPVAFCGDAGFMMSLQELDTAVRNEIPLSVIVMNDEGLGTEYHSLLTSGQHAELSMIDSPDIAAVAAGFGAESYTVRSVKDVRAVADGLNRTPDGPVVYDCRVNREVRHRSKM